MNYLSVPDLHAKKEWIDTTVQILEKVRKAAIKYKVNFVAFPGDMHDNNFHLGKEYNQFQTAIKSILEICPVGAVVGTPGHEHEAMYGPLEKLGLILLRPENVYGFYDSGIIEKIGIAQEHINPDAILFGIPELKKDNIQSISKLSAESANVAVLKHFETYIDEFVSPMRLKYKNMSAIGIIHGNISDSKKENSTNIILKSSDIVIHSEILARANLDYWSAGHIHIPTKFEGGSYAGSWSMNWGETDFLPSFELIDIGKEENKITRIPYGTSKRMKITEPLSTYDPNIAYWLLTENKNAFFPDDINPLSRITYADDTTETRRVTSKEIEAVRNLWDLFLLIDPDIKKHLKKKVDLIQETIKPIPIIPRNISMTYLKVEGCIFFDGKPIALNLSELPKSLNLINGDNGAGKSSLLGFLSPYPLVIGKDLRSGRISAIKDFFDGQDSKIEKQLFLNGVLHEHFITIKGAHTQNPKVECYLTIAGIPQLEKATFDTMFEKCEELYGSFNDYLLTTFYVQPLQGKTGSSLMSATMTDARNLVQNIAGKDREKEKMFALEKKKNLEESMTILKTQIDTMEETLEDKGLLELNITEIRKLSILAQDELLLTEQKGAEEKKNLDELQIIQKENEKRKTDLFIIQKEMAEKENRLFVVRSLISTKTESIKNLDRNREIIEKDKNIRNQLESLQVEKTIHDKKNEEKEKEYLLKLNMCIQQTSKIYKSRTTFENNIKQSLSEKKSCERERVLIDKPCEFCGKISSDANAQIIKLNSIILEEVSIIVESENNLKTLVNPKAPEKLPLIPYNDNEKISLLKSMTINTESIKKEIEIALKAAGELELLSTEITQLENKIKDLKNELDNFVINDTIDFTIIQKEEKLELIRKQYSEKKSHKEKLYNEIKFIQEKISTIENQQNKITQKKKTLTSELLDIEDWTYLSKMLSANKIPALELDIELDNIDEEATKNIEPFLDSRYSFRTLTQDMGKKNLVDRFDIMIHDGITGKESSFFFKNPGHKAFFNDSYVKALIKKRNEKAQISYSPVIFDEADNPVKEHRISMYYDINRKYFEDKKVSVICISQKDSAINYMDKIIDIEDLKT